MLVCSFAGHRPAVGLVVACSMLAKVADAGVCYFRWPGADWKRHVFGMVVDGGLVWALM